MIGTLPTPGEVRPFLADESPDKRSATIDRLLAHPMHATLWATRYLDITGCDVDAMEGADELRPSRARLWHDWFRTRFAANAPYDWIARGVLCETSWDGDDAHEWARREVGLVRALRDGHETATPTSRGSTCSSPEPSVIGWGFWPILQKKLESLPVFKDNEVVETS